MSREIQALVMVLLGGAVLRITIDGTFLRYVKPGLGPFLLATGVVILILGLLSAWYDGLLRRAPAGAHEHDHGHAHGHDDGHGHGPGGPAAAWLLLLPVLAIFLVAPPALGAYTAEREDSTIAAPREGSQFDPLPAGDPLPLSLTEYAARAVWDDGISLEGRTVLLTGFVSAAPEGRWYLTRLGLSCCAADAFATKVLVIDPPYDPPTDVWVQITGRWVPGGGTQDANAIPWIQVQDMAEVPPPANPYE